MIKQYVVKYQVKVEEKNILGIKKIKKIGLISIVNADSFSEARALIREAQPRAINIIVEEATEEQIADIQSKSVENEDSYVDKDTKDIFMNPETLDKVKQELEKHANAKVKINVPENLNFIDVTPE